MFKVDVPGHDEVRVEAGETVLRRTDSNVGELQFRDWQGLYSGGDWTVGPVGKRLMDQDKRSYEASDDDTDPEQSDQPSFTSNVGQSMDGGGLQELLHTFHSRGLLLSGTCFSMFSNYKVKCFHPCLHLPFLSCSVFALHLLF